MPRPGTAPVQDLPHAVRGPRAGAPRLRPGLSASGEEPGAPDDWAESVSAFDGGAAGARHVSVARAPLESMRRARSKHIVPSPHDLLDRRTGCSSEHVLRDNNGSGCDNPYGRLVRVTRASIFFCAEITKPGGTSATPMIQPYAGMAAPATRRTSAELGRSPLCAIQSLGSSQATAHSSGASTIMLTINLSSCGSCRIPDASTSTLSSSQITAPGSCSGRRGGAASSRMPCRRRVMFVELYSSGVMVGFVRTHTDITVLEGRWAGRRKDTVEMPIHQTLGNNNSTLCAEGHMWGRTSSLPAHHARRIGRRLAV